MTELLQDVLFADLVTATANVMAELGGSPIQVTLWLVGARDDVVTMCTTLSPEKSCVREKGAGDKR